MTSKFSILGVMAGR